MTVLRILCSLILVVLVCPFDTMGQSLPSDVILDNEQPMVNTKRIFMAEAGGAIMSPQNAMRRNFDSNIWGFYFGGLAQVRKAQPLFAGLGFTFANIDKFANPVLIQYDTGFIEKWNSETKSSIFNINFFARYFIEVGSPAIIPFLELNAGTRYFYTSTTLSFSTGDETSTSTDEGDNMFYYGGGLGLSISITEKMYITGKWAYNLGLAGKYYVQERNTIDPLYGETIDVFELKSSATDMLVTSIMLTYSF